MSFSKIIIDWYQQNKRELPWRNTKNPYYIWLSEIILQQTRVNQGWAYYEKFIATYPTIFELAEASEEEILKLWQGLGYYSRARSLHYSAQHVVNDLDGKFPTNYKDLLKLKGVGDYTASAIASICYNEPCAVVDGNVYRVLARYYGIKTAINSTEGVKIFKKLAEELLDKDNPATFNQAIMEFGAMLCKPKNPDCNFCPFQNSCNALAEKTIESLPYKDKKLVIKNRFFNYIVIISPTNKILLNQRKDKGIWRNLYQFPLLETANEIDILELIKMDEFQQIITNESDTTDIDAWPCVSNITLYNKTPIIHKLTHQHLSVKFWIIKTKCEVENSISIHNFEKYPVPILIHNFAEDFFEKY